MKRYGLESRNWPTFLLKIPGALSPANGRQRTNIEVSEKYFPPSFTFTLARRNGYKLFFFVTLYSWFKEHARYANLSSQRKNTRGTPIYPPSGRTRAVRQFILPAEEHARNANLSSQWKNTRGAPIYPPSGRTCAVRQFILPAEESDTDFLTQLLYNTAWNKTVL